MISYVIYDNKGCQFAWQYFKIIAKLLLNIFVKLLVDGGFTDWSEFGACSVSCGGGTQKSTRSWTNPAPAHGGKECEGETERTQECGKDPCPGKFKI